MAYNRKILLLIFAILIPFLCTSCVGTGMSKSARIEPGTPGLGSSEAPGDKNIVDTWELLYRVDDKGDEERPKDASRTLIEFTRDGQVIFNRTENAEPVKNRTGKYSVDRSEITITDDLGNTVKWPYQIMGDTLVTVMPEEKNPEKKSRYHWRRFR